MAKFRTFFEDLVVGDTHVIGHYRVRRDEVLDFARLYDPQDFHLDDAAAAQGPFGRLAASGWHTAAMMMRMLVDEMHATGMASLGGAGVEELRWLHPVYPDDNLRLDGLLLDKRRSRARPEMGLIRQQLTAYNQDDTPVLRCIVTGMIGLRDPSAA
jgi:acyl dehydratase